MARDDFYDSPFGAIYSAYMERPRLTGLISRVLWGGNSSQYYASMRAVGGIGEDGTIVDCPCGAGPALRAISPDTAARYVAVDLSASMIRRARERAKMRGLTGIEFIEADATAIPLPSESADLFLSYWGLHCFANPAAAVAEAARVLKPGGRLVGCCFVYGSESLRQRLLVRRGRGGFGQVGTQPEVQSWLDASGFVSSSLARSGPMLFLDAQLGDA